MILYLKIKSLDKLSLKLYSIFLKSVMLKLKIETAVFKNLPKKKKRISILKSPHVDKKAQEQFEVRIYKGVLKVNTNYSNMIHLIRFLAVNKPKNIKITFLLQSYLH
jgi:ribosomal protein S10